ncbi:MAG TPA: hypothetical protein VFW87_07530, partial [Pirellulales bacterium]|nr:hypothetical protein [Pirellulales bacterium]
MKKILLPMLAVALLTLPVMRTAVAADNEGSKPVAVLAIASYERLMTDIAFIGNLTGNPDLDKNLEGMIELFTQGQGLAGLDKKRPLGIALNTDGLQFQPLVILPVTDLKQLLTALEGLVGAAEEGAGGVYQLDVFGQQIFIKENNKWAYISMSPEVLDHLPKDGAALFDGLEKNYDIAGRLHVQNVPEVFRTMLIDQLRQGVSAGLARQDGESDDAFEARKKMVDSQIDSLTKVINDLEQLTLGISLDPAAKTAKVDLSFTAVAGTDSAKQFASAKPTTSSFAGFLTPDAAASLNLTTQLAEKDAAQFVSGLEALRTQALEHITSSENLPDEASKKLAQEITGQVFDAIKKTFETGKIDAGAVLNLSDKSMALVVGAYVADPKGLEDALRKFAKLGESDPKFPKVNFNASEHAGIDFHTASIPVPADRKVSKVLGEKLDVAVGIGEKTVYLALGTDSLALAKQVIDRSKSAASKQVPPFQLNVALTPIFQFAAALQENDAKDDAKD